MGRWRVWTGIALVALGVAIAGEPGTALPRPEVSDEATALADTTAMTPRARKLWFAARPSIVDAATLASACERTLEPARFLLGCVDRSGRIHLLRIDRPELAPKVPVTAAHELLHLVFSKQSARSRARLTATMDEWFETWADDTLRAELDAYPAAERTGELHARLGTEVAPLPPELERHYARWLGDRGALVASWAATEQAITDFQVRIDELKGRFDVENSEAGRLAEEIDRLRGQGRVGESNGLVPAQNAAVGRAQHLSGEINALIEEYQAMVASLLPPGASPLPA